MNKTIELIDPHEHAGRSYPPGSELTLAAADADWLISLKKAKPVGKASTPSAASTDSKEKAA